MLMWEICKDFNTSNKEIKPLIDSVKIKVVRIRVDIGYQQHSYTFKISCYYCIDKDTDVDGYDLMNVC